MATDLGRYQNTFVKLSFLNLSYADIFMDIFHILFFPNWLSLCETFSVLVWGSQSFLFLAIMNQVYLFVKLLYLFILLPDALSLWNFYIRLFLAINEPNISL